MFQQKKVGVVIPAAGHGKRMKSDVSKQYIEIDGKPILAITLKVFQDSPLIDEIIVVVGESERGYVKKYIQEQNQFTKISDVVVGGRERQDSVYAGLKALSSDIDLVLIHDAVRPFLTEAEIDKMVKAANEVGACVLGVRVKETIKIVNDDLTVSTTPDRNRLFAIQTPQAFHKKLIIDAYQKGIELNYNATDDAMMVEKYGNVPVKVIEGSYQNIKITTPEDLAIAKQILDTKVGNIVK